MVLDLYCSSYHSIIKVQKFIVSLPSFSVPFSSSSVCFAFLPSLLPLSHPSMLTKKRRVAGFKQLQPTECRPRLTVSLACSDVLMFKIERCAAGLCRLAAQQETLPLPQPQPQQGAA
ncbi:unnamed protein product [Urochloa humidicola]